MLIYGGSFDPPHVAHTTLPPLVADLLGCTRILYVPAAISPHKQDQSPANRHHRLAMLAIALADVPNADISTLEFDREGPSYTIDTLRQLRAMHSPSVRFRLLIGADQALSFHRWKDWSAIIELATPVVMLRPPLTEDVFRAQLIEQYGEDEATHWLDWTVPVPLIDASSTGIRADLAHGVTPTDVIDPAVVSYIRREGLYGAPSALPAKTPSTAKIKS